MPTGIVIPVDELEPIYRKEFGPDITEYQQVIGGYFQAVDFTDIAATLFVDEEGKLKRLPRNGRATLLLWWYHPALRFQDVICGPAILLGMPDAQGDTKSVPDMLDDFLFDALEYRLTWKPPKGNREDGREVYNNAFEALDMAIGLGMLPEYADVQIEAD